MLAIAPIGGLRLRQAAGLACALMPVSTIALVLHHDVVRHFPEFGANLTSAFLGMVIVMEIVGPIAVQWGLKLAGETAPEDATGAAAGRDAARAPGA